MFLFVHNNKNISFALSADAVLLMYSVYIVMVQTCIDIHIYKTQEGQFVVVS